MWHSWFTCVTRHICMCDITHSHVWRDTFKRVVILIHVCYWCRHGSMRIVRELGLRLAVCLCAASVLVVSTGWTYSMYRREGVYTYVCLCMCVLVLVSICPASILVVSMRWTYSIYRREGVYIYVFVYVCVCVYMYRCICLCVYVYRYINTLRQQLVVWWCAQHTMLVVGTGWIQYIHGREGVPIYMRVYTCMCVCVCVHV